MKLNEYQHMAARTANPENEELLNYGLGLGGESGEVLDIIKKVRFHGHALDIDHIQGELGDILWYVSNIAKYFGLSLEDVATYNIEKLKRRYPDGFSSKDSIRRVDTRG